MKKYFFLISLLLYLNGIAQDIWKPRRTQHSFILDKAMLEHQLDMLIDEKSEFELIPFPTQNGALKDFKIYLHEAMSKELRKKFPYIHSFAGQSLDGSIHITISCTKDHFSIRLIDKGKPFSLIHKKNMTYILKADNKEQLRGFKCNTAHKQTNTSKKDLQSQRFYVPDYLPDGQLRTLRFAVAVTGETSDYFINKAQLQNASITEKKAAVLQGIQTSVNNINIALERDLGVRLILIDRSEDLIFLDRDTDPFQDVNTTSTGQISSRANDYIINTIGSDNFDIGHIITSPRNGAGGEAVVASLCSPFKAEAITASSEPEGFSFEFTLFAHEIGHQLGGNHTQNANCQRNSSTAVEVSSGTTIMGYSGACGALDVQESSDPFFHNVSIDQIIDTLAAKEVFDTSCVFEKTTIDNNLPQVSILPNDHFIPVGTPFYLDITATDLDGDNLTYSWEQLDIDVGSSPPVADQLVGPQFRVLNPTTNSRRDFPSNIVSSEFEVLPTRERSMSFNVIVRDGKPLGIGYSNITLVNTVGDTPFTVKIPSIEDNLETAEFTQRDTVELTWAVGITDQNVINTTDVSISLVNLETSEEKLIIESTPNDGTENVVLPLDFEGEGFRLKVSAIDNIFYNVSNPFKINPTNNRDIEVFNHQNKTSNHLIFSIKKSSTIVNTSQIILTFTEEISDEVLNLSTISPEISFNGINYEALTTNTIEASSFENDFQIRVPFNLTNGNRNIEKLTLGVETTSDTTSSKVNSTGSTVPLELSFKDSISLFPIPTTADDFVTIRSSFTLINGDLIEISFIDIHGQLVKKLMISETEEQISVSSLASGVYFLQLVKNGKDTANFKILIQ